VTVLTTHGATAGAGAPPTDADITAITDAGANAVTYLNCPSLGAINDGPKNVACRDSLGVANTNAPTGSACDAAATPVGCLTSCELAKVWCIAQATLWTAEGGATASDNTAISAGSSAWRCDATSTIASFDCILAKTGFATSKVTRNVVLQKPKVGPVGLGEAEKYVILAASGVTTIVGDITGDIGVSPIALTAATGFALILDPSGQFAKSGLVAGEVHSADMGSPISVTLTTATGNRLSAYNDARAPEPASNANVGAGTLGLPFGDAANPLFPGAYTWTSPVAINADIFIMGTGLGVGKGETDVFIFRMAQTLTVATGVKAHLTGGALAKNIFWQVGGATTFEVGVQFKGVILAATNIAFKTGATNIYSLEGRALAGTAVTLDHNMIKGPAN
jgi:hypothetical protein